MQAGEREARLPYGMTSERERRSAEMKTKSTSSYREDDCANEVARKTKGGRLVP